MNGKNIKCRYVERYRTTLNVERVSVLFAINNEGVVANTQISETNAVPPMTFLHSIFTLMTSFRNQVTSMLVFNLFV